MSAPHFSAGPDASRIVAQLDGLSVIYHRPSGATHIVGEPVPEILAVLGDAALSAPEILARLVAVHDLDAGDAALCALEDRLAELVEAGLVAGA